MSFLHVYYVLCTCVYHHRVELFGAIPLEDTMCQQVMLSLRRLVISCVCNAAALTAVFFRDRCGCVWRCARLVMVLYKLALQLTLADRRSSNAGS